MEKETAVEVGKNVASTSTSSVDYEIHPLATVEASLDKTVGYFNQSRTIAESSGYLRRKLGMVDISVPQGRAIDSAGDVIESARNLSLNFPSSYFYGEVYREIVRPLMLPVLEKLGKYRQSGEVAQFCEGLVEHLRREEGELDPELEGASAAMRAFSMLSFPGYSYAFTGGGPIDSFLKYASQIGSGSIAEILGSLDQRCIREKLRGLGERVRHAPLDSSSPSNRIVSKMRDFIHGFSTKTGYNAPWGKYDTLLQDSRKYLLEWKRQTNTVTRDFANSIGWVMDVSAGLIENLTEEEFQAMRELMVEKVRDFS